MGSKYTTTPLSGYNASPPSDGGAVAEENRITWAKIKTKLPDPIKTALESMDSKLVTFADVGPSAQAGAYTTVAGDHMKTLECSGTFTVSLMDATSAAAGYTVEVNNQGSGTITVSRATAGNTINGTAADVTIVPKNSLTFRVNVAANGYEIIGGAVPELAGLAKTDNNFIVGNGTAWVAESGVTARTSLGAVGSVSAGDSSVTIGGTADAPTVAVATNGVTFAKMQDISTDTLIGRDTAATGDPEQITVGGGLEFTGTAAIQRSALTGDVTASAGSNATTIANSAVTYAKMQNVSATDKLLGRATAGAGVIEEIALTAAGRALIDDTDAATQRTTLGLGTAATANTGTSGHVVPYLDTANTFADGQIITSAATGAGIAPILYLDRTSTKAANDYIGAIEFRANNSTPTFGVFGILTYKVLDPSAGSEDSRFGISTYVAGSIGERLFVGSGLYTPSATGGDKGADTINASAVYDDNVLLTCYAIEHYLTGSVTQGRWDLATLDLELPAEPERIEMRPVTTPVTRPKKVVEKVGGRFVERIVTETVNEPVYDELPLFNDAGKRVLDADGKPVTHREQVFEQVVTPAKPARTEVRTHSPAAKFATRAAELLDPELYGNSWKATGHLPAMPSPAEWEASGKKMATGDILQRLWESVETQAIHIDKLLARIKALENRVTALGG